HLAACDGRELRLGLCRGGLLALSRLALRLAAAPASQRFAQVDPGEAAPVEHRGKRRGDLEGLAPSGLAELVESAEDQIRGECNHQHAGGGEELAQVEPQGSLVEGDPQADCRNQAEYAT